jgi:hypothetical protein
VKIKARSVGFTKINPDDRVFLDHQHLRDADFSGRKLLTFAAVGCHLEQGHFEKCRIDNACFGSGREPSEYIDCSFDRSRIRFGPGGFARFVRCSFRNVVLEDWFCFAVELVNCKFSGRMRRSVFNATVPEGHRALVSRERNEFVGNDFSEMELIDVDFRSGIDLSQQKLPSGAEYLYVANAEVAMQFARANILGWKDLDLRRDAIQMVTGLEDHIARGQRQLLLRRDTYLGIQRREAIDRVFGLLCSARD